MSINLNKGQSAPIADSKFTVGIGWTSPANKFDLDVSVFMLNVNKVIPTEEYFVFYNNLKSPDGAVIHSGDCRDGEKSATGDDETISIDLSKLSDDIVEMVFAVTIHEGKERNQNFGMLNAPYIRILNNAGNVETIYKLDENFAIETGVLFGRLIKMNGTWSFEAMGVGQRVELGDYVSIYYTGIV